MLIIIQSEEIAIFPRNIRYLRYTNIYIFFKLLLMRSISYFISLRLKSYNILKVKFYSKKKKQIYLILHQIGIINQLLSFFAYVSWVLSL